MYFFNARWVDVSLGRFIQADSIIPNPGDPQSYDRYAYSNNNPIRFIDPSGHASAGTCRVYQDGECVDVKARPNYAIEINYFLAEYYGITLKGTWSFVNKRNLYEALNDMENALGDIREFTSGTTFEFVSDPEHYGGHLETNDYVGIQFHSYVKDNGIPFQTIYHEVGHLINYKGGNYFINALSSEAIYTSDDEFVMGGPEPYNRNSNGYKNPTIIDRNGDTGVLAEQHSIRMDSDGNSAKEEWADLVANYVADNFDKTNAYGTIRSGWVSTIFASYRHPNCSQNIPC